MDILLITKILFIVGGTCIFALGFINYKRDKGKLKIQRCSATTTGHITGFDDRDKIVKQKRYTEYRKYNTYHRKTTTTYYAPYVKFEDETGESYEIKYPYPIEKHFSNGQKVTIKYNPANPYDFYISGDGKIQVFSSQAIIAGLIMIAVGIALIFNLIQF